MKILYAISNLGIRSGGPAHSVFYTSKGLKNIGCDINILTYSIENDDQFLCDEDFIISILNKKTSFAYSSAYKNYLQSHIYDIYHIHGIWQYPSYITAKISRRRHRPYIISPRGMLYPQALNHSRFKKKMFLFFSLMHDLHNASAIHVTCMEEMQHIRKMGIKSPIAFIPNPLDFPKKSEIVSPTKLRIGYLGRVHPRKNIDKLLYVWDKLNFDKGDGELLIIGDGDIEYMNFLQAEQKRLKLQNVLFTGFLSGEAKEKTLRSLSYLVVPSDFENFGMIIPEALSMGVPVIASKGTPWEELDLYNCGWWVENDLETLINTLKKAISLSEAERLEMGMNGQYLVKNYYSIEIVANKMIQLYDWILGNNEKPEFVYV
jgi:glycosyltransferase involved in cell wall biosynthesis